MNKYYAVFHLVGGGCVRITFFTDDDIEDSAGQDCIANAVINTPFVHSFENGKLMIINMSNVTSITVTKVE